LKRPSGLLATCNTLLAVKQAFINPPFYKPGFVRTQFVIISCRLKPITCFFSGAGVFSCGFAISAIVIG